MKDVAGADHARAKDSKPKVVLVPPPLYVLYRRYSPWHLISSGSIGVSHPKEVFPQMRH